MWGLTTSLTDAIMIIVNEREVNKMKTVICIHEDNHGLIGIAKDYKSAIDFLIREEWLDCNNDNDIIIIRKWDNIDKFNDEFEGRFYLEVMKVEGC